MSRRGINVGSTRMKVRTKKNTSMFGRVGTVVRVRADRITLEFDTLRDGRVAETFTRDNLEVVRALKH